MITPEYVFSNSSFLENLFEHRFIFDLQRDLVLRDRPLLLNVLKSEVDVFGFDLVLIADDVTYHVQMKTMSGKTQKYDIQESLWKVPNSCVIWVEYDRFTLEPINKYSLLRLHPFCATDFKEATRKGQLRRGYRQVNVNKAHERGIELSALSKVLFP